MRTTDQLAALQRDRARLRLLGERREAWSDASIDTATAVLGGYEEHPLAALASRLRAVAAADFVTVLRRDGDDAVLTVDAAVGPANPATAGDRVPIAGSQVGVVVEAGQPRLLEGAGGTGPEMAAPMRSPAGVVGALVVGRRPDTAPFDEQDLELLAGFADHATVAIELAAARVDRERMTLLEDRARIARDLHDTVIQQLFAAGLALRATAAAVPTTDTGSEVLHAVGLVDAAIAQIRTAVLALSPDTADSVRHRVFEVVGDLAGTFALPPQLVFDGPVDLIARGRVAEDLVAVVRESLVNVRKHAAASRVRVAVRALGGALEVEVWDDGIGVGVNARRSGLSNLAERADRWNGTFAITGADPGTRAVWRVPYDGAGEIG